MSGAAFVSPAQRSPDFKPDRLEALTWNEILGHMSEALGASACCVGRHDFASSDGRLLYSRGYDPALIDRYPVGLAVKNPWFWQEAFYRDAGNIHRGQDLVAEDELVTTDFYYEFLEPQNLLHRLCGILERDGSTVTYVAALRSPAMTAFDDHDLRSCALLLPQLRHCIRLEEQVDVLERERGQALDILDHLPVGVMILDTNGEMLKVNRAGRAIVRHAGSRWRRIQELLQGWTKQAIKGLERTRSQQVVRLCDAAAPASMFASLRPLSRSSIRDAEEPMSWALLFSDPSLLPGPDEDRVRILFGLTRVEARLSIRIARGLSLQEAAADMRLARNTVRGYLKQIFRKTGAGRQADLVRLILSGAAMLDHQDPCPGLPQSAPPRRQRTEKTRTDASALFGGSRPAASPAPPAGIHQRGRI